MKQYILTATLLLTLLASSCTQEEFQQSPYGEEVPYEEVVLMSLNDELTSSGVTIFKEAIALSNIPDSLAVWKGLPLTFLVPSDQAMVDVGLDMGIIRGMSALELDTLVMYHAIEGKLDTVKIKQTPGNVKFTTKMRLPGIKYAYSSNLNYLHYIAVNKGDILVDGSTVGKYMVSKAKEADIIFVNSVLKRPTKTIWQTMKEDNRLSMFMAILEANDKSYAQSIFIREDGSTLRVNEMEREAVVRRRLDTIYERSDLTMLVRFTSVFAPTNEAFIKAGYNTPEEFLEDNEPYWINRGEFVYFKDGLFPYDSRTFHKTDSILSFHSSWAKMYYPSGNNVKNATVFFSNELTNERLGNYLLSEAVNKTSIPAFYCPFVFSENNGRIQMKLKNAKDGTEAATIEEKDILTINGPVHIVNRLFIPDHY